MAEAAFLIDRVDDLIDVERRVEVRGLPPREPVTVASESRRGDGSVWRASATFKAGPDGVVSLMRDAPLSGSYAGASTMGFVWSQSEASPPDKARAADPLAATAPIEISLEATVGARRVATATLIQRYVGEGVVRREVREQGLVGTLFTPATPGPHPAIVIFNGSGGGINEPRAALYASRGYAAFALAYFNAPGLSPYISNTPLEYFQRGLRWLRNEIRPANDFVAITGQSRGGELVLLLGAMFPEEISAILAYVPAAYVHSGQSAADPRLGRTGATWTLNGEPLPHLWENNRTGDYDPYDKGPEPRRLEYTIKTALADRRAVERSRIPVERIRAPLLLVHGTDDGWWPTDYYCDVVEETLAAAKHSYPVKRLRYVGAGHAILFPYVPTTLIVHPHAVSGILSTSGGTPAANAVANEESWAGVLALLDELTGLRRL